MRHAIAFVLTAAFCAASAANLRSADSKLEKQGEVMAHFYENPSKEAFDKFQKDILEFESFFKKHPQASLLLAVFIAKVSEKYGYPIGDTSFAEMAGKILDPRSKLGKFVNGDNVSPTKLDVWWACFFATGDDKYLEKIFRFVGKDTSKNRDVSRLMIYGAANWSFKSNCEQHEKVMAFAKAKLEKGGLSQTAREFLESCVNQKMDAAPGK